MERRNLVAAMAIALLVTTIGCAANRPPSAQDPHTGSPLPAVIEGVEQLGDNTLRTKPGFEWVKQPDGTLVVQRRAGTDGGVIIRVGCGCDLGPYACEAVIRDDTTIKCETVRDCLACKWFKPDVDLPD